ncbi:coiled-coil domain-containing glutamate-rich protein 1-like [Oncorhynchus clarkii lewisi]|uniref:coiled-coil domain-containing glutamate-rich protein 1-like n=1 Tax=Oncorhynchus clarkii lewisi TaxID=490388 RepID=UPI0039B95757
MSSVKPSMSEPKSPGSYCGVPAQRSSQWGPEMVLVKLEDCSQPLELNVIVKEEEEEREVKEEDIGIKEEVEESAFKEEAEESAFKEEVEESAFKEEAEESAFKEEAEESAFKEEAEESAFTEVENREEEEEVDPAQDLHIRLVHLRDRLRPGTRTADENVGLHNRRILLKLSEMVSGKLICVLVVLIRVLT